MAEGDWWRHGVVYQIYPRSFADSNGDGIGDLPGITSKLDHLNDGTEASLGVDAIWLSPFYPSPMADFGYDVSDYCDVDESLGTLADFDHLVGECHRRSIRVIIDLVPNHTSDRHEWFLASRSARDDPKREWYVWADQRPDGSPPSNWLSVFQTGPEPSPAWTFDSETGQYYLHSFLPEQPDLNWLNPQVRDAMHDVMRFWLDRGVDGFRVDAVQRIGHDPSFRDDPMTSDQRFPEDLPVAHEVVRGFRRVIDTYPDRMMVGEVYLLDPARMVAFYGGGSDEFHLVFNFSFLNQPWSARGFRRAVDGFDASLPSGAWPDYTLSNHDHPRTASRYEDGGLGEERARLAAMMLLTLRGTPFLYYGEEIGMHDAEIPRLDWVDPMGRDGCRTPMRWTPDPGAGFTTGDPWVRIGSDLERVNVAGQLDDPTSMFSLYRRLIWFRKASPSLQRGAYRSLSDKEDLLVFVRGTGNEQVLVALNFSTGERAVVVDDVPEVGEITISTRSDRAPEPIDLAEIRLRPLEGVIVTL